MLLNCYLIAAVAVSQAACLEEWFSRRKLGVEPGPSVRATRGEVWPKPRGKITKDTFFIIRPNFFHFKVTGQTCGILERAIQRYKHELRNHDKARRMVQLYQQENRIAAGENFKGYLDEFSVNLGAACESRPHEDMDEHCRCLQSSLPTFGDELRIDTEDFPNSALLTSQSVWGILRGLETWSQLIYSSPENNALVINSTSIIDFPRFSHRGLLIDTSRHFLPLRTIYGLLEGMAMSKLNVLHWHIVDDQSFPFQSQTFPDLSAKGAYAPTHVYTSTDVEAVIEFAHDRGIRVVPEFDTPGHTRSWGQAYPELLTECYNSNKPDGSLGAMNPIAPETYVFMRELLKEVKAIFPDSYFHVGGDEVEYECWESNPILREYMEAQNCTPRKLEGMYVTKIIEMATNLSMTSLVWQEVFDNGANLPNATIVQIWKPDHRRELQEVTRSGYKTILSSCWYLDGLSSGGDWHKFYRCDPHDFSGSDVLKRLVIGGEACMWGEVVDVNNVVSRVWPRACAAAEKLWSSAETTNIKEAERRLEEHTCRMNRRKIPAQPPNGPGFCPEVNFT